MLVYFIDNMGRRRKAHGEIGESVMQCATRQLADGIIGECGGAMACATCHAYVAPEWMDRLPSPGAQEREMLDGCIDTRPESRLTCQIRLSDALDGITFTTPASQI